MKLRSGFVSNSSSSSFIIPFDSCITSMDDMRPKGKSKKDSIILTPLVYIDWYTDPEEAYSFSPEDILEFMFRLIQSGNAVPLGKYLLDSLWDYAVKDNLHPWNLKELTKEQVIRLSRAHNLGNLIKELEPFDDFSNCFVFTFGNDAYYSRMTLSQSDSVLSSAISEDPSGLYPFKLIPLNLI